MEQTNGKDLVELALDFANKAHSGQRRKLSNIPYIMHPMEVAVIISGISEKRELIVAGLLHDVVEDTECELSDIKEMFGDRVAELVASETENKRPDMAAETTWKIRKQESLEELKNTADTDIKILWLSDKLSNMRSFYRSYLLKGDEMWQSFNQKDKNEQEWYYKTIVEYTAELKDYPEYKEYKILTDLVFGKDINSIDFDF